jgi:hypothetical protein
MNKLTRLIESLDEEDLRLIKQDLEAGSIEKLINHKIREQKQADYNKVCPVCQTPIDEESLTLIFGPKGLRKKASFCAIDCLEYFIERIKREKKARQTVEGGMDGQY